MNNHAIHQPDFFEKMSHEWLVAARNVAKQIAKNKKTVSSDDVRKQCPITGAVHRNVIGSLFRDKDFIWIGVKRSTTKTRKGGMIGVYKLREQAHT